MTLLAYALLADPDPLQAGGTATLTLIVSNPGRQVVTAESIAVLLPVGTSARALTPDASGIQSQVPVGWSVSQSGGELTLRPASPGAARVAGGGLSFVFAGIRLNAEPGTVAVTIAETASSPAQPAPQPGTATLTLDKFPRQFQVSELSADALVVEAGGSATLLWTGTTGTYRMQYSPGDGPRVDVPVGNAGPYTTQPLFRTPNVVVSLAVSVAVPGQDRPLVTQRQLVVDVRALTVDRFDILPPVVPVNGVAKLTWRTSNATSAVLQPGNRRVEPNGSLYVVVPATQVFTLIALDGASDPVPAQRTVTANPSLTVNAERWVYDAPAGMPGRAGRNGAPGTSGEHGSPGQAGASVGEIPLAVPGLDLTGMNGRVRLASARGGNGGAGGRGGNGDRAPGAPGGFGGNGGSGGTLSVTFTPAPASQTGQLVVDVSGGAGGGAGAGGDGTRPGPPGQPGRPGPDGALRVVDEGHPAARSGLRVAAVRRQAPARSDTLGGYALIDEPGSDGMRMLTLSLSGAAEVERLVVPLPLLSRPDGWTAVQGDDSTTLTPPAVPSAGAATFTFMPVSARPAITLHETAGGRTRTAFFPGDEDGGGEAGLIEPTGTYGPG